MRSLVQDEHVTTQIEDETMKSALLAIEDEAGLKVADMKRQARAGLQQGGVVCLDSDAGARGDGARASLRIWAHAPARSPASVRQSRMKPRRFDGLHEIFEVSERALQVRAS